MKSQKISEIKIKSAKQSKRSQCLDSVALNAIRKGIIKQLYKVTKTSKASQTVKDFDSGCKGGIRRRKDRIESKN